jgi:hypothetical protein
MKPARVNIAASAAPEGVERHLPLRKGDRDPLLPG